jgi:hypothetical protein
MIEHTLLHDAIEAWIKVLTVEAKRRNARSFVAFVKKAGLFKEGWTVKDFHSQATDLDERFDMYLDSKLVNESRKREEWLHWKSLSKFILEKYRKEAYGSSQNYASVV